MKSLTTARGKAMVVKTMSHIFRNQYFTLFQGMMSVKKHMKKNTN